MKAKGNDMSWLGLEGKVALVTGAAHRVGKAIALELARQGVHILVHYGGAAAAAADGAGRKSGTNDGVDRQFAF